MGMKSVTTGIMSAFLACSGGAILIVQAAETAGLSKSELLSWFSSVFVIGGLLNFFLTLKYKLPFAGAHSITGIAFIGTIAGQYSFPVLSGGFILSGMLMLLAGSTGLFAKAIGLVPKPLIDALLAGLLVPYVIGIAPAAIELPLSGLLAGIGLLFMSKITKRVPPPMWAILLAAIGLGLEYDFPALPHSDYIPPHPVIPEFTLSGLFSIAIPLFLLVVSNDLAVALSSLKSHDFDPPVNKTLAASGISSMVAGLFGGHAANVGGMMSALCSSQEAGPKPTRRWAAIVSNGIVVCFGLLAWKVIDLIQILPPVFVSMITGISLLGLFGNVLRSAFSKRDFRYPAILTFVIAILHVNVLGISTPVWALICGIAVMQLLRCSTAKKG